MFAARNKNAGVVSTWRNRDYEMLQFCMFGGHSGTIRPDRPRTYITLFAGCELRMPTMATLANAFVRRPANDYNTRRSFFFVTIFGGTEIKRPTLVEEFLDLQESLRSGQLPRVDWEREVREAQAQFASQMGSLTLFAGFQPSELPTENEELDRMALSYNLGQIPDVPRKVLMTAIGQDGMHRCSAVIQAVSLAGA